MQCRIQELRHKEVVCLSDGTILGTVCDVIFDTDTASILSIVIFGKPRLFGMLGREDDYIINWNQIEIIGEDTILIGGQYNFAHRKKSKLFSKLKS